MVILALILLLIGAFVFSRSSFFHVEQFDVEGNAYYTDDEILLMGGCETGKNIFWDIDSKKIRSRLLQDAYMEDVKVRRLLPHTVKITVTERAQTAAIAYGDKYVVIDAAGIVLRKAGVDPKVTVLKGLTISKLSMGERGHGAVWYRHQGRDFPTRQNPVFRWIPLGRETAFQVRCCTPWHRVVPSERALCWRPGVRPRQWNFAAPMDFGRRETVSLFENKQKSPKGWPKWSVIP